MSNDEVLVVVSKLKNYIKSSAGMNTSGNVPAKLSEIIKGLCQDAVEHAKKDGRKTVMDRDFASSSSDAM
ncbi:MAG: hypothetical protein KDD64_02565 [Bdellovibrionales bacterium]|nr:hypothetical protein [Bdellovibrionales bacterium]